MARKWTAQKVTDALNGIYDPQSNQEKGIMPLLALLAQQNQGTPSFTPPGNVAPPGASNMQNVGETAATPEMPLTQQMKQVWAKGK
jgi:hypothetical protein